MKESDISANIIKFINDLSRSRAIKMHSGAYQGKGEPDIFACIAGFMLVIETKIPGEKPRRLQEHCLREWERAGAVAISATSVADLRRQLFEAGIGEP